jgi:OmpA-OmpF porin, OOP family
MRNRCLLGAGVALTVALGCAQANAQFGPYPPGAFYLGPEGGWSSLSSQSPTVTVTSPAGQSTSFSSNTNSHSGFNAGVRGGYMWGPWRFEEEYSYHDFSSGNNSRFGLGPLNGSSNGTSSGHANAAMTNVIYDFTLGWPITPHIGAGIGAVNVDRTVSSTVNVTIPPPINTVVLSPSVSGNQWAFGYQAIAGIRYMINPALAIDADYRYTATPDVTINKSSRLVPVTGPCCLSASLKTRYQANNFVASLTMMFGAPPPAPPPPAPPAPPPPPAQQVYLVFFDWDKYNITPEGTQILEAAAAHWKAGGAVQIQVTGYTDLSGSAGYNQRLSERRANAVASALAGMGVAPNDMVVSGRGMNNPRVPTPLGVREPQNRRVEIVFP